ncbi:MAG: hypothetical protein NT013_12220 [Planctomycetia bacterium]|nr:hypothetical protein [Planctomycetia bacterium]
MTTILHIALINAVTVLPLALLAFVVGRAARRPALSHAMWVLVILKFVTPPLFHLPVTIDVPVTDVGHVSNVLTVVSTQVAKEPVEQTEAVNSEDSQLAENSINRVEIATTAESIEVRTESLQSDRKQPSLWVSTLRTCSPIWARRPNWRSLLLCGWLAGSGFWMSRQLVRAVRFHRRVLRSAVAYSQLQQQTDQLAKGLRLRRAPQVLIVGAAVSPMLWGCGSRAKLLFPSDLAERLDADARATLITHELAHFARGDHWVRLLELIATSLFWWHPIVWFAKHQIEVAEEECCDAWVVGQFPDSPKLYAEALLDTIDYLCERRQALPPVACGLGQAHFLRHRLTKIMRGAAPKAMSRRVRFATTLCAALLLPLQPFVFGSASVSTLRVESIQDSGPLSVISGQEREVGYLMPGPQIEEGISSVSNDSVPDTAPRASTKRGNRGEKVWSTAASADGRFVVRATTARRVVLTDLNSNAETDLPYELIKAVAFAPDGDWFTAAGQNGQITIWDSARGELLRTVATHSGILRSVAVSPRGDTIAAGSRDGSVLLINLANDELLVDLPTFSSAVNCVRFSSDGRQLAVAVGDWMSNARGEVALLNVTTGQIEVRLPCAASPGALTFASNDELIVGLWDGRTQLWNLVNRQVVGSAMADKNVVSSAAFSPDNPSLREAIFVAESPKESEDNSPLAVLRSLFAVPIK